MRVLVFQLKRCRRAPLFWLALLYLAVGSVYARATPLFEKPDEPGHYGYILYLREHLALPPILAPEARSAVPFRAAQQPAHRYDLTFEFHQPPLYYATAALLTAWLPDDADLDAFFTQNPYVRSASPGSRNDNRNYYLHPPDMTVLAFACRWVSLLFGLGSLSAAYFLAAQIFARNTFIPMATAALVGFQPTFLFTTTAISNDPAVSCLGALIVALLVHRLQRGPWRGFAAVLGVCLGLAALAKESGLVFFPLAGLALLAIHRGFRPALFRDGVSLLLAALLTGGWWYARNALLYADPLLIGEHPTRIASAAVLWAWMKRNLLSIELSFWANQSLTFLSPIGFDKVLIGWGRLSLGVLALSALLRRKWLRERGQAAVILASWPMTFLILLAVYWSPKTLSPYGRFLFPAVAPLFLLLLWAWYALLPPAGGRLVMQVWAGAMVVIGSLISAVSLYPPFQPARPWGAAQHQRPAGIVYVDAQERPVARLIGYNLPQPFALPGEAVPLELCWEPLARTPVPYAVFVQLLDLSRISAGQSPGVWGRRETYPGLGRYPTDRWTPGQSFCETLLVPVFPETPTLLGAAIEVGLTNAGQTERLSALDAQGRALDLVAIGGVPVLARDQRPAAMQTAAYRFDQAVGLVSWQAAEAGGSLVVTTTWQARQAVPYDATLFIHVNAADGRTVAQLDRQPLDGRFATSYWPPGSVITDVAVCPLPARGAEGALTLNLGLYTWPSLQRLPVTDAAGAPLPGDVIVIELPARR